MDFLDVRQIYLRSIKNVPLLSSHNNEKVPYQQAKTSDNVLYLMNVIVEVVVVVIVWLRKKFLHLMNVIVGGRGELHCCVSGRGP